MSIFDRFDDPDDPNGWKFNTTLGNEKIARRVYDVAYSSPDTTVHMSRGRGPGYGGFFAVVELREHPWNVLAELDDGVVEVFTVETEQQAKQLYYTFCRMARLKKEDYEDW